MNRCYVMAPDHAVACDLGPTTTVVVNYQGGGVYTLLGPSARWWRSLATSGDLTAATGIDGRSVVPLLSQLRAAGVLIDTTTPTPWPLPVQGQPWRLSFGTEEVQAGRVVHPRAPLRATLLASMALAFATAVQHVGASGTGMCRLLRLLRWATSRTNRPATASDAEQVIHAVRRVGRWAPGRVACLEESAAVVLALAVSRHRVTWCHGIAADPVRLHAWIEVDGQPVAEPTSTRRYTILKTVPVRTRGDDHH
jgi:hypothetical protein